jgi:thiol-disulfide isomerase/thioredoxin
MAEIRRQEARELLIHRSSRRCATTKIFSAAALVLLLAQGACDRSDQAAAADAESSERPAAPAFSYTSLEGQPIRLAELEGKVVLVNFWATWCGPCRMEIPELTELHRSYKDQGLVVLGLSLDGAPESYVRTEAKRMGADYPIVLLGEAGGTEWGGIMAIPTSFLIDRRGRVVHALQGYTPIERLADLIRPLLKEAAS